MYAHWGLQVSKSLFFDLEYFVFSFQLSKIYMKTLNRTHNVEPLTHPQTKSEREIETREKNSLEERQTAIKTDLLYNPSTTEAGCVFKYAP